MTRWKLGTGGWLTIDAIIESYSSLMVPDGVLIPTPDANPGPSHARSLGVMQG